MREDLLHFIWKYKKLYLQNLVTNQNESILILDVGSHNHQSGPDFFNAKIEIGGQLWAGNVEIHPNASDWYAHHHENDIAYDNVILHVVWNDDLEVYRRDNTLIPTLELKKFVSEDLLRNYKILFDNRPTKFINCEHGISKVDAFTIQNWLDRIYIERLEEKSVLVNALLINSKNDWEKVLFALLLKNFGLHINGESFLSIAEALDFSVVRKLRNDPLQLESVLLGLPGLLDGPETTDAYLITLRKEYAYLKKKFDLNQESVQQPEFFKLRPTNFPTIRLSQIANVYIKHQNLFQKVINASSLDELYAIFEITASNYWDNHFTFGKVSKKSTKKLTNPFIDLLIINTILPLKFCYGHHMGITAVSRILPIIEKIRKEDNGIIRKFNALGIGTKTAGDSQAVLQLYNSYCSKNKCLQCAIGNGVLNS